jgi:hypothetical protein
MTRYWVCLSCCDRPMGINVCAVKGCLSRMATSNSCLWKSSHPSSSSSKSKSPQELGMLMLGSCGRRFRGEQTNMFITALAGFLLGARPYRFDMCVTSRYLVAEPWLAATASGGGMRLGMGSCADGDVVGFSMTVPNCEKAVGVRSSIGIRIEGAGIEVGISAARRPRRRGRKLRWICGVEMELGSLRSATDAITIRHGTLAHQHNSLLRNARGDYAVDLAYRCV